MNNETRTAVYLRDRTRLTPARRHRVQKHEHGENAQLDSAVELYGRMARIGRAA